MKIKYGKLSDEYLAPIWFLGFMHDINHDASYHVSFVFGSWYIGVTFKRKD